MQNTSNCIPAMCVLSCAGTAAQRAPGVLLPVCSCVEVLGLSMDREGTRRLLRLALKAAAAQHMWQVGDKCGRWQHHARKRLQLA